MSPRRAHKWGEATGRRRPATPQQYLEWAAHAPFNLALALSLAFALSLVLVLLLTQVCISLSPPSGSLRPLRSTLGASAIALHAAGREQQPINVVDAQHDKLVGPTADGAPSTILAVPFFSPTSGALLGVMEARGKEPEGFVFSSDDLITAQSLLAVAALQLEHCQLKVELACTRLANADAV